MKVIISCLIAAFVLCRLAVRIYTDWLFLRRPRRNARGTAIGHRRLRDEGRLLSLAIVRFEADDGRSIEFTNRWAS